MRPPDQSPTSLFGRSEYASGPVRTVTQLATPPLPRLAPDGVFDAFGWCASGELTWGRRAGGFDAAAEVTSANPPEMIFVLRKDAPFLPRERAKLHAPGMGFEGGEEEAKEEWALAPWGIDDATDALFEHRAEPSEHLWLAASSITSLFWGLHDWAHFHNHGPFERRAWTELQCDVSALAWLEVNRAVLEAIGVDEGVRERVRREVTRVAEARFAEETSEIDRFDASLLGAERVRAIARELRASQMD